jgi:plasmid stabilization system protein ParE
MSLRVEFAAWWDVDVNLCIAGYAERAGIELAERFIHATETTVQLLMENPHLGRRPFPTDPDVGQFHSWLVQRPFQKHIVFYRFTDDVLMLERLIHGARDLPRRLRDSPYSE